MPAGGSGHPGEAGTPLEDLRASSRPGNPGAPRFPESSPARRVPRGRSPTCAASSSTSTAACGTARRWSRAPARRCSPCTASGRAIGFLSNNSRATGEDLRRRLHGHGITIAEHVVTPLEIIGEFIAERFGPSRVLVMGAAELAAAVRRGGHALVGFDDARQATVVVVGNDFDVSYARIAAAARAAAAGAPLVTPNMDPRLPVEGGDFLPGCAAFVEAVAVAAGVRPLVVGKPDPPLFHVTMRRMGVAPDLTAMVGDTPAADMRGGRAAGMRTVLYAPNGARRPGRRRRGHPLVRRAARPRRGRTGRPRRCTLAAMFDIGFQEILLIGVLALLVFGPSKLPELGRMFGRAMREFRRASDEFRTTVETNLHINDLDPEPAHPGSTAAEPAPVDATPTYGAALGERARCRGIEPGHLGGHEHRALLRAARLEDLPPARVRVGEADSRDRPPVLQSARRCARSRSSDLPGLRALGARLISHPV